MVLYIEWCFLSENNLLFIQFQTPGPEVESNPTWQPCIKCVYKSSIKKVTDPHFFFFQHRSPTIFLLYTSVHI